MKFRQDLSKKVGNDMTKSVSFTPFSGNIFFTNVANLKKGGEKIVRVTTKKNSVVSSLPLQPMLMMLGSFGEIVEKFPVWKLA